ncbi:Gfo/Idh/MocA family oxidoreductase [Rhodococcus sp. G-MC3]|uniref:Gfo/Idh/MocA family protein n=1 Tax=Rhodococcus sp. G-MC3 TaxID=3046209 RepID=UPI0024BAF823|nr:Gfo/Idh/MocA family oxidoreductase [Rhodococcus sp. G-MC3]MDJ0396693.1 Gfo/Idh/MocA family oxidoreductase [Rhodococcus sp. G-MC3]
MTVGQNVTLPSPRTPSPLDAPPLRWGILGPGWIAAKFAEALRNHTSQQITAVGSRNADRGEQFAADWKIPSVHLSYEDLVGAPDIDVVYISTPHTVHAEHAMLALEAGKHVVVEKPLALDGEQGRAVAQLARAKGLFAMEAMWTAFLPKFSVIDQILSDGLLGNIATVLADHGEYFESDHRIYDPALAGGPLLDLGSYPVYLAHKVFGRIEQVTAAGQPANDEINGQISAVLQATTGAHAVINTTILSDTPSTASICGTNGVLRTEGVFYRPGNLTVSLRDGRAARFTDEIEGYPAGLAYEAAEAARRISVGDLESPLHTLDTAVRTLDTLDEIRRQIGIVFPA